MSCNFGKNILRYRRIRSLPLEDLAAKARIPASILVDIESGAWFPTLSQIERLLHVLDVSWQQIAAMPE